MSRPTYEELAAMLREIREDCLCPMCEESRTPCLESWCKFGKMLARLDEPEPTPPVNQSWWDNSYVQWKGTK